MPEQFRFRTQRWMLVALLALIPFGQASAGSPIDHKVLAEQAPAPLAEPRIIHSNDGAELAFRRYQPSDPKSVLIFYHSAGLHSRVGYPQMAYDLARDYDVAVYLADLRGHGESGGDRGDAPSVDALYEDIDAMLEFVHMNHGDLPVYVGGHSSGAALVLNYISEFPRAPLDGLVFLSPNFGQGAKLNRNPNPPFVEEDRATRIYNKATLGLICRHCEAVSLNYPHPFKVKNPGVVTELTTTIVKAITPSDPVMQVRRLRTPFIVYTGSKDELVQGGRTKMFFKQNGREPWMQQNDLLRGETHLSVLLHAAPKIGEWLQGHSQQLAQN